MSSTLAAVRRYTAGRAVQRHLVVGVQMDTFVDVDLSLIGPVRTDHPAAHVRRLKPYINYGPDLQRRPATAVRPGHVGEVCDDEAVGVGPVALEANRVTTHAVRVQDACGVNSNVHLVVLRAVESFRLGCALIHVVHVAIW